MKEINKYNIKKMKDKLENEGMNPICSIKSFWGPPAG